MTSTADHSAKPRRRTLRNTLFSLLGKAQAAVFSYIIIRLLLDVLTVEEYGLYSLLFIGVMINFSMVSQFGIPHLLTRFVPELFSSGNWRGIREIFEKVFRVQLLAGSGLLLLVYLFAPQICAWINFPHDVAILRLFSLCALFYLLSEVYHLLFSAVFRQSTVFTVTIVYNSIRLLLLGGIYFYFRSFSAVVIAEGISLVCCVLLYALSYRRTVRRNVTADGPAPTTLEWPRMRKYASLAYANEIGVSLLSVATDFFLVSSMLGGVATGFYGLANRINDFALKLLPMKMLGPVIQPLFFSEYGANKEKAEFGFRMLMKATL